MSASVIRPPAIIPAAGGRDSTTTASHGHRLDVLLDAWPCPTDAAAQLRAVAAAWTAHPAPAWSVDTTAATVARAEDAAAAAAFGVRLCHVGTIEHCAAGLRAWRGIAALPARHLLAGVPAGHWAAVIGAGSGHQVLLAAPAATAADAVALVAGAIGPWPARPGAAANATAPSSTADSCSWLMRLDFAHPVPAPEFVVTLLADAGLHARQVRTAPAPSPDTVCWADVSAPARASVAQAIAVLHRVHRVAGQSWVVL
jgi:hypothetical protein